MKIKEIIKSEIEKRVKSLFENNESIYDEYGNYYYMLSNNDYRFYHKLNNECWVEESISFSDIINSLLR